MIGKEIQLILKEIEEILWTWELDSEKPNFPPESLASATKIFAAVLLDKMYELQEKEKMSLENRFKMADKAGENIRKLIKTFTGLDSFDFYK